MINDDSTNFNFEEKRSNVMPICLTNHSKRNHMKKELSQCKFHF